MAVDHTRALPVHPDRLEHMAQLIWDKPLMELPGRERVRILEVALQAEQVEYLSDIRFFLNEAYDIYNARFR